MIKSEEQRQQEMRAAQNEWWGKLTDVEKSKATGMVLDQATGWWAVSDVDSRERLMRTYIALKENAAPVEDNPNGNTDEGNSTENTEGGSTEGTDEGNPTENSEATEETADANTAEDNETTEEKVEEESKTEETDEQNGAEATDETGKANPTEENAAPVEKAKTPSNKRGGKKTSKK